MTGAPQGQQSPASSVVKLARRWNRTAWVQLADRILAGAATYASVSGSLIRPPGPISASGAWSDGLEGYARSFTLAAYRLRGSDGDDPHGLIDRYGSGVVAGTDPDHPDRWPRLTEMRQAVVEASCVAYALAETRPWIWDRLDDSAQERIVDWLSDVIGMGPFRNNWLWFQTIIETFLVQVGADHSQADLDRNAEIAEELYVGDGWYSDGDGVDGRRNGFDWYAGWVWHLHPWWQARMRGEKLGAEHAARMRQYLEQAQWLFGGEGPLFHGRSLPYRMAMLGPVWAGAITGATPLSDGVTRSLSAATIERFVASGIPDESGLLPIGWYGSYPRLRQSYTGSGSTYWAGHGFAGLVAGDDDPLWQAEPEAPAGWLSDRQGALPVPGWLVSTTTDGIVRVIGHGADIPVHTDITPKPDDPGYRRIGYSNLSTPQYSVDAVVRPRESAITLLDMNGEPAHRGPIEPLWCAGRVAASRSRLRWLDTTDGQPPGVTQDPWALRYGPYLTVISVLRGIHEVRVAWWDPVPDVTGRANDVEERAWDRDAGPWLPQIGGWALPYPVSEQVQAERSETGVTLIRPDNLLSALFSLRGVDAVDVTGRTDGDPAGELSLTPIMRGETPVSAGEVFGGLVVFGTTRPELNAVIETNPLRIRWSDGEVDEIGSVTAR